MPPAGQQRGRPGARPQQRRHSRRRHLQPAHQGAGRVCQVHRQLHRHRLGRHAGHRLPGLQQPTIGKVDNPYNIDRWSFAAVAGQQVRFRLLSPPNSGTGFSLTGPRLDGIHRPDRTIRISITLPNRQLHARGPQPRRSLRRRYSFRLDETSQTPILAGTPLTGQFHASGQAQIFALTVTDTMPLLLQLANSGTGNQVEIYAKLGSPPTRGDFDYKFGTPAASNQSILVPTDATGTWYVLVYGDYIPTQATSR